MNWHHREPTLDEILSDSIVRAVMEVDGVNPHQLKAMLRRVAQRLRTTRRGDGIRLVPCAPAPAGVAPMANTAAAVPAEQHFVLSNLSPGPAQRRLALAVVLALLVAFFFTAGPLSTIQLPRIDAFVPAYAMAMFVNDAITAVLLFAQFSILRSRALLIIASGYLFTALIIIPWLLTFPGVFAPGGLLGAGLQSTNWLYILWHGGFPTFVMGYALLKDADPAKRLWHGSVGAAILSSVAVTMAVVCAATFLFTAGDAYLPRISLDPVHFSRLWLYVAGCLALWSVLTLIVLWMRRRSVLDLWLMVVMCAYAIEIYLVAFPGLARFTLGWYFGRVFSFMSGSLVLFVLLYEITMLYAQLLRAVFAQRREREARLMTGDAVAATIAHEVRQPLSGMITNADAGLRWLDRSRCFDRSCASFVHPTAPVMRLIDR